MLSKPVLIVLLLAGAAVAGVWSLLRPPNESAVLAAANQAGAKPTTPAARPGSGGSGEASALPAPVTPRAISGGFPAVRSVVPLKSPLAQEFERARNLKPFYERYMANPEAADAETRYFAAVSLERCLGRGKGANPQSRADQLQRLQARFKENDPTNAARIDAFNRSYELCEGFGEIAINQSDINKLYQEAANLGNPAAKIWNASTAYQQQLRSARGLEERRLSEEHLAVLREGLASGDPFAIERAGQLLASSTQLAERRVGPNGDPYNPRDWRSAWELAACDRGANCGADSQRVLNGCAYQGACGYDSLEAYLQFNELPPNVYQAVLQNRALILDAIAQGRWDWLGIAPGMGRTVAPGTTMQAQPRTNTPPAPPASNTPPAAPPKKTG